MDGECRIDVARVDPFHVDRAALAANVVDHPQCDAWDEYTDRLGQGFVCLNRLGSGRWRLDFRRRVPRANLFQRPKRVLDEPSGSNETALNIAAPVPRNHHLVRTHEVRNDAPV